MAVWVQGRSWAPPSNAEKRPFSTAVDIPISDIIKVFDAQADVFYANAMGLDHGTTKYPEKSKNGKTLQQNKGDLLYAADNNDASATEKAIILAIAMSVRSPTTLYEHYAHILYKMISHIAVRKRTGANVMEAIDQTWSWFLCLGHLHHGAYCNGP